MGFITEDFLLSNDTAKRLYRQYAAPLPIIDYHCHLNPAEIAADRPFETVADLWLAGDHYKWRAMRANGVPEEKITGQAAPREKFRAWAESVENCLGNPLYHWTALELKRYFHWEEPLSGANWERAWAHCNALLADGSYTPRALIKRSNVEALCTTDSLVDTLEHHKRLAEDASFGVKVLPTLRPDEAMHFEGAAFTAFVGKLEACAGHGVQSYEAFLEAIGRRVDFFHARGCRLSDHGLTGLYYLPSTQAQREALFAKKRGGAALTEEEARRWQSALLVDLARLYAAKGWAMQIHFGALRNNNQRLYRLLGADCGCDSIYDQPGVAAHLNALLNAMEESDALPKLIVYNLDPSLNDAVAAALANFQKASSARGKLQFGSGWWFNDTKRGMLRQLGALADQGLLMHFVGMLTDSRSFISYTRHEYFRRIFCDLVGRWAERGEIPADEALLRRLVENVCYRNAKAYFAF